MRENTVQVMHKKTKSVKIQIKQLKYVTSEKLLSNDRRRNQIQRELTTKEFFEGAKNYNRGVAVPNTKKLVCLELYDAILPNQASRLCQLARSVNHHNITQSI